MKKRNIKETIIILSQIVGWVVGLWVIYALLLKLAGHSPTLTQVNISLTFITLAAVFHLEFKTGEMNERTKRIERVTMLIAGDLRKHINNREAHK